VQFSIIGVDFLRYYGLLVDRAGKQLVNCLTLQAFYCSPHLPGDFLQMAPNLQPLREASSVDPPGLFT
jgi:hypothetical protein